MQENEFAELKPYILQCAGRIGLSERQRIESLGIALNEYISENAFLVRMRNDQVEAVNKLPFIKFAISLNTANKVEKRLMHTLESFAAGLVRQTIHVIVKPFEDAKVEAIVNFIKKSGGKVTGHDSQWLELELGAELLTELADHPDVQYVEEIKDFELLNDRAEEVMRVPSLWNNELTGAGQIIGIADTGLDTGIAETIHPDFKDRIVAVYALGRSGDASDFHGHGTHVAGSAFGSGTASEGRYKGIAPGAAFVFQSVMNKDGGLAVPADLGVLLGQAYEAGARVYNISWGASVKGAYNYAASQVDKFIWEHDDLAVSVAAGNSGNAGTIYSPATAKNVITVGASENNRIEKGDNADNPAQIAYFSSRGPAADGRFKPDVVAPGTWVLSTKSSLAPGYNYWEVENSYYAYSGGTSMSAPMVAGLLALLREYFTKTHGVNPSAALLKAAILDGAFQMPAYSPNDQGRGRLNSPEPILDPSIHILFVNQETKLATGERKTYEYAVSDTAKPLKVTLVWTDYPGSVNAAVSLVNDLDLIVESPSGQVFTLNDHLNNVEQIIIPNLEAGVYKVTVSGRNVPMGYQHYALFISGGLSAQTDNVAPVVHITSPVNGSTVKGSITVSAEASDNVAVTRVEFYLDEKLIGTNTSPPHTMTLDTTSLGNNSHTITVKAYDGANNFGQDSVTFIVSNPTPVPDVKITWPLDGVTVKVIIKFRVNVSSKQPLANISFFAGDTVLSVYDYTKVVVPINNISAYTTLDTTRYPNGPLTLKARACDKNNNCGELAVVVTMNNP